ncbi:MAG: cation:proton antiporter domain-containing protein, partial [Caulobacteraceae bacterium]
MQLSALFLALITAIGWLNVRFLKLPASVAMLGAGVVGAVVLLAAQTWIGPFWGFNAVRGLVKKLDFTQAVLGYMLAFLLFASGLQVDLAEVRKRRVAVWTLATVGVLLSTALVGLGVWAAAHALGTTLPLAWALTFGALISPTDPIAVLSAVKTGAVSPRLGAILQGEALFNDGVGFVAFTAALAFATSGAAPHPLHTAGAVLLEAGGGLMLGLLSARLLVFAFRGLHDHVLAVTATLALAVGVYVLADLFHLSGPIAAASAGLIVGSDSVKARMSDRT